MTIAVEPDHVAFLDPEWAADAAAFALSDGYGIPAFYSNPEPVGGDAIAASRVVGERGVRSYRFAITFQVDPEQAAFDDPEWAADAAHGALTNEYGVETVYSDPWLVAEQ